MNPRQVYVVHPEGMTFENWANAVIMSMNGLITGSGAPDESEWRSWAATTIQNSHLTQLGMPSPEHFNTWYEWARAFVQCAGPAGI